MKVVSTWVLVLVGCGGTTDHRIQPGTGEATDGGVVARCSETLSFVIDHIMLPSDRADARLLGCDLDGQGGIDNQLGQELADFSALGVNVQRALEQSVATGKQVLLVDLCAADLKNVAAASFRVSVGRYLGPTWDPVVAFSGNGEFARDPTRGAILDGVIRNRLGQFGPGAVDLPVALVAGAEPLHLTLQSAQVFAVAIAEGGRRIDGARVCGGLSEPDISAQVIPAMAQLLVQRIAQGGDLAVQLCATFDGAHRCAPDAASCGRFSAGAAGPPTDCIRPSELETNATASAAIRPDVVVDGLPLMSFGIGFSAVPAVIRADVP